MIGFLRHTQTVLTTLGAAGHISSSEFEIGFPCGDLHCRRADRVLTLGAELPRSRALAAKQRVSRAFKMQNPASFTLTGLFKSVNVTDLR
jgi:hypothetical protein